MVIKIFLNEKGEKVLVPDFLNRAEVFSKLKLTEQIKFDDTSKLNDVQYYVSLAPTAQSFSSAATALLSNALKKQTLGALKQNPPSIIVKSKRQADRVERLSVALKTTNTVNKVSKVGAVESAEIALIIDDVLNFLDLDIVCKESSEDFYHKMAHIGDALVKVDLANLFFHNRTIFETVISNNNMRLALIKMGILQAVSMKEHIAGTLYEAIYFIAHENSKSNIKEKMLRALIGDELYNLPVIEKYTSRQEIADSISEPTIVCLEENYYKFNKSQVKRQIKELRSLGVSLDDIRAAIGYNLTDIYKIDSINFDIHNTLEELKG